MRGASTASSSVEHLLPGWLSWWSYLCCYFKWIVQLPQILPQIGFWFKVLPHLEIVYFLRREGWLPNEEVLRTLRFLLWYLHAAIFITDTYPPHPAGSDRATVIGTQSLAAGRRGGPILDSAYHTCLELASQTLFPYHTDRGMQFYADWTAILAPCKLYVLFRANSQLVSDTPSYA